MATIQLPPDCKEFLKLLNAHKFPSSLMQVQRLSVWMKLAALEQVQARTTWLLRVSVPR